MSAEIELPDQTRARMDDAGAWTCDAPKWLPLLSEIARGYPSQSYLPAPFGARLRGTLAGIDGARLVREDIPEAQGSGLDEEGRLVVH